MSERDVYELDLSDDQATLRLAARIAPGLVAGDTILIEGQIGAGKTHFCRGIIQTRLGRAEDVPSPTFTLVQTYEDDVDLWHADLYRLTHPDEMLELGLEEAFQSAICLVEWPDRLGQYAPDHAIRMKLAHKGAGRTLSVWPGNRPWLKAMLDQEAAAQQRNALSQLFLASCGWQDARREVLGGDASSRRYERLFKENSTRLLMDAPNSQADSVADFAQIDQHLVGIGLSAPIIYGKDFENGYLLIEDFGDGVFAKLMREDPGMEECLYPAAVDALIQLQINPPASNIPSLSVLEWARSAEIVLDWYCFSVTGERADPFVLVDVLEDRLESLANLPQVMIHRDYHAENLMWLPDRPGVKKVGLLDFQLAQMGQPAYDLVSLLQDARRDVSPASEEAVIRFYLGQTGYAEAEFLAGYSCLGALRALRILGVFARLSLLGGKPGYVDLMPRVWRHLERNLAHPGMQSLQAVCTGLLPPPDEVAMQRIRAKCGSFR